MPRMNVKTTFPFRGKIYRSRERPEDSSFSISREDLIAEVAKGKHPTTGKWVSPVLNHAEAADAEAAAILGIAPPEIAVEESEDDIEAVRSEFDRIGKAYDRRWRLLRLRDELAKAKKEVGA